MYLLFECYSTFKTQLMQVLLCTSSLLLSPHVAEMNILSIVRYMGHVKVNKTYWEKAMNCLISPTAPCSEHLRHRLPLLWWKLHAIGPQDLALAPRLLNITQLPLQSCWSLHPHVNESFTSKRSFVCMHVCNVSFQSLICSFCSKHKAHSKHRPWVWISQWS